jgi:hypothetical protein
MKTGDFHANKVSGVRKNGTPSANGHQGRYLAKMAAEKILTDRTDLIGSKNPAMGGKRRE